MNAPLVPLYRSHGLVSAAINRTAVVILLLLLVLGLPFASSLAGSEHDEGRRIRIEGTSFMVGDQEIWINGVNTPWHNWNDFGGQEGWNYFDSQWWDEEFSRLKANGVNATRIWITCNGGGGILINADGMVTGAAQQHWDDLDELFALAAQHELYVMATLISFDHTIDGNPHYQSWRNFYMSDAAIASMVNNYVIPFVDRYKDNPWLFAIEPCNEIEWVNENPDRGAIPKERLIRYVASVAKAVQDRSDILVTQGAAAIKWNSVWYEGDWWSDASMGAQVPGARIDFYSPHYYDWQKPWYGVPFYMTPQAYGLAVDKPAIVAEAPARGSEGRTVVEDYQGAFANGWRGVMAWSSNAVDEYGDLTDIAPATNAIWQAHPEMIFPPVSGASYDLVIVAENGTVVANPSQVTYASGAVVSLQAIPDSGYAFSHWSGHLSGSENPTSVVMNAQRSITAHFSPVTEGEGARLASVTIIDEQTLQVHVEEGVVLFHEDASRESAYTDQNDLGIIDVVRYGEVVLGQATAAGTWSLSGGVMGAGVNPIQVHRKTKMNGMAQFEWQEVWDYRYEHTLEHFFYLRLPEPMQQGQSYTLTIGDAANIDTASVSVTYDIFEQRSEAIKLNLVGFLPGDSVKAVDLYMWMGDGGARDYSNFIGRPVYIRNLDTGATQEVSNVSFWRSSAAETYQGFNYARSDIWRADFTGFSDPGSYRIAIEGVGASQDFEIRGDIYREPFMVNTLGFFYMRVGQEDYFEGNPVPRRPLLIPGQDGHMVYETTMHPWHPEWYSGEKDDPWDDAIHFANYSTGVEHLEAWGGHSDAADWDRHLAHVSQIYDLLLPYILSDGALDDDDLGIAESGNGIPDVLDEARHEVDFFLRLRPSTGGYAHGLSGPMEDYSSAYLAAATGMAAWANAANAAMMAEAFRIADRLDLMEYYRDAAIEAFTHASGLSAEEQQLDIIQEIGEAAMRGRDFRQMAAAFLYNVTGDTQWEDVIHAESLVRDNASQRLAMVEVENGKYVGNSRNQLYATAAYLLTHRPVNYAQLHENMHSAIISQAIEYEAGLRLNRPSRRSIDNDSGYFQTNQNVHRSIIAHAVTTDEAQRADFLDALILEADWGLGRNPLNMIQMTTATTPLASRRSVENMYTTGRNDGSPGLHPGHTPYMNMDDWAGGMVMGSPSWMSDKGHPAVGDWPKAELFFNTRYVWAHSEFTPRQTMRGKQALYGYLLAVGRQQSFVERVISLDVLPGMRWFMPHPPAELEENEDEDRQSFGALDNSQPAIFQAELEAPEASQ